MTKLIIIYFFLIIPTYSFPPSDWIVLFDGKNVDHWRGYRKADFPWDSWTIEDNCLKTLVNGKGVDLVSRKVYKDFQLELEWKVKHNGNSGIFYFGLEKTSKIWKSALEMQILDNIEHKDALKPNTSAGSLYDLIAPNNDIVKPVGQFNYVMIKVKNNHVEHWLNGSKILEYQYGSDELRNLIMKSKFKRMPYFGKTNEGLIGLQGDHGEVWFRNIRIREL